MKNNKIIISGPPSSGKTTIINELKSQGYNCFNEISPIHIKEEKVKKDKFKLSNFLFTARELQYEKCKHNICFFDRSMIDVVAYLNYWKIQYPLSWKKKIISKKYNENIFYTPLWENIYTTTISRKEEYLEAFKIDKVLRSTYIDFGYNLIEVPKLDLNFRVQFIKKNI